MFWELGTRRAGLLRNCLNGCSAVSSMFGRCHGIAEVPSDPGSSVFQLVWCVTGTNCSRSPSVSPGYWLSEKLGGFAIQKRPALGRTNETLSDCLGRVLVKLLFTGVELRIGLGGLELENLRIIAGGSLTGSSSEEVESLSSSSALVICVAKWIGWGIALERV